MVWGTSNVQPILLFSQVKMVATIYSFTVNRQAEQDIEAGWVDLELGHLSPQDHLPEYLAHYKRAMIPHRKILCYEF